MGSEMCIRDSPKSYLKTRTYQDGIGEQVQELLSEFFGLWSKNIAFPELALPVVVMLKRWLKDAQSRVQGEGNKNQKVNGMMNLLVQKLEANTRWVEERRAKVDFAPNNRKGVETFLQDVSWEKTPLGAYVVGQRKVREERARVAEEARKEDERRKDKEKRDAKAGNEEEAVSEVESDDVDEDESDEEEEIIEGGGAFLGGDAEGSESE